MTRHQIQLGGVTGYATLTLVGGAAAAVVAAAMLSGQPAVRPAAAQPIQAQALFPAPPPVQKTVDVYDQPPARVMSGSPGGELEGGERDGGDD